MIVRILGEGQLELPEAEAVELESLDEELMTAVDAGDEARFAAVLQELLERVRTSGKTLPPDTLTPSDLVLPSADSRIEQVRELLRDDGLIPG